MKIHDIVFGFASLIKETRRTDVVTVVKKTEIER